MYKIVYVRAGEKLQEVETFGEYNINGETGYIIQINNQTQLLNKTLTWLTSKEAQKDYLITLEESANKNLDIVKKLKDTDMEVIKIETEEKSK